MNHFDEDYSMRVVQQLKLKITIKRLFCLVYIHPNQKLGEPILSSRF